MQANEKMSSKRSRWPTWIHVCLFAAGAILMAVSSASNAAPVLAGTSITSVADATYFPAGASQSETTASNVVSVNVLPVEALTLTDSQTTTLAPGSQLALSHVLTNIGNTISTYSIEWSNNAPGCPADTFDLADLSIVRDVNNNGLVDTGDAKIQFNTSSNFQLAPGEATSLLLQAAVPVLPNGSACIAVIVKTALQSQTAKNVDVISIGEVAVLRMTKSTAYGSGLVTGGSRIDFTVAATNTGSRDATATGTMLPDLAPLFVDRSPAKLIVMRDIVPEGLQYIPGTLQGSAPGLIRLYRLPGDPPFSYRTTEDASAIEVAIGMSAKLAQNSTTTMQFGTRVLESQYGDIKNTAQSFYENDGTSAAMSNSNTVVLAASSGRIGVAKAATPLRLNRSSSGELDGTASVTFSIIVRNYGKVPLYNVQLSDVLEGNDPTQFGAFSASTLPAAGRYGIVPGSLKVSKSIGSAVSLNAAYDGTVAQKNLLAPKAFLPVGAEVTIQFDVIVNLTGHDVLSNTARVESGLADDGILQIRDDSVNGTNPDMDGDGNPNNDSSATVISLSRPELSLVKTASSPRRISANVYEVDYTFAVMNRSERPATNVRVIENFDCAFDMDQQSGAVASWELVGRPTTKNGLLVASSSFTGKGACDRQSWNSDNPFSVPVETALSLVDGLNSLTEGQSEEVRVTIRVTKKVDDSRSRVVVRNKSWAVSRTHATGDNSASNLTGATTSVAQTLLVDPQGTVYDSSTRMPVQGAEVTFSRQSCSSGPVGPIVPSELFGGDTGAYKFRADGSVTMVTGVTGGYQFYLLPVGSALGLCSYSISVTAPAGGNLSFPSQLIPARSGSYSNCGQVISSSDTPQQGASTAYYLSVTSGFKDGKDACDVTNNHIPLDPAATTGLLLRKEGSKQQVDLGDFLDYALTLSNKSAVPLSGVEVDDTLPPGFAFVAGSARLDGNRVADPQGGMGPTLRWQFSDRTLPPERTMRLQYRVRVGVGAPVSQAATNRATAKVGTLHSNTASWTVRVNGGVFSDEAFAFGKVYMECTRDHQQDGPDEVGVPGIRLFLEDGTNVITDSEGKWSLYGLKAITHVLRIDESTLPAGVTVLRLDNRNADNPASRFVDLKKGEFHKANFALGGCDVPDVRASVSSRHESFRRKPAIEGDPAIRTRLDAEGRTTTTGDRRGMPANGVISASGGATTFVPSTASPLIDLPTASTISPSNFLGSVGSTGLSPGTLGSAQRNTTSTLPATRDDGATTIGRASSTSDERNKSQAASSSTSPAPALSMAKPVSVDLENSIVGLDNHLAFIGLQNGDTVASQSINVRTKGALGATLGLIVNGERIDERRVGKKATLAAKDLSAWEYIGVILKPGLNRLKLEVTDSLGDSPSEAVEISVTAPDRLGQIHIDLPDVARANPQVLIPVRIRLTDAAGVPVTARSQVTVESSSGDWADEDLNPSEPGLQIFVDDGSTNVHLMPPGEPGTVQLRVTAGALTKDVKLSLLPELRPMIAVGIVEGSFDLTKRGKLLLNETPAGAAFEGELTEVVGKKGESRVGLRGAVFLKGTVKGDYLLTIAGDTDKASKERLFRDIRPDEFYPVYGDSSTRAFEAQSSKRAYVRIDKDRSYLLYGDFTTVSSGEVRQLSQVNRTLTGLKHVDESERARITSYVSRTANTQQVEEFAARGISGPYYLAGSLGDLLVNSERVEILVRDRMQPGLILQVVSTTRFVDYTIEPLSKRILFTRPIASLDANLNPQSIRVTYEVDSGGPKYTVAGTDVQVRISEIAQLGIVANLDQNPENSKKLAAATALMKIGPHSSMAAEVTSTQSDLKGSGSASRIEIRHQDDKLGILAQMAKSTSTFDNPGSTFSAGRSEALARVEYKIDTATQVRGQTFYSDDALSLGVRRGTAASVQRKFGNELIGEVGLRYGSDSGNTASMFDYNQVSSYNGVFGASNNSASVTTLGAISNAAAANDAGSDLLTVRARLTAQVPHTPQAQVFVEGEQDVRDSGKHVASVGGNYSITEKTRAYGRYEFASSLGEDYNWGSNQARNVGILGIDSSYMEGGRVYNEYRLSDSLDGRAGQAAIGIRNTVKISENWRATGGFERTRSRLMDEKLNPTSVGGLGNSVALVSGIEYLSDEVKASGILEGRRGDDSHTVLATFGAGYKVDENWSMLGRAIYSSSQGSGENAVNRRVFSRQQLGFAYRPVASDVWNALARYEHRTEDIAGNGVAAGSISGNAFGSDSYLPGQYKSDIISAHLNVTPAGGVAYNARVAAKRSTQTDDFVKSTYFAQLLQGRATFDINKDWDVGLQAGLLHGSGGALQKTFGIEVGYQAYKDLWFSVGFNFLGLTDRELTAGEYTSKGMYLRLRFKFDEKRFGWASSSSEESQAGMSTPLRPAP